MKSKVAWNLAGRLGGRVSGLKRRSLVLAGGALVVLSGIWLWHKAGSKQKPGEHAIIKIEVTRIERQNLEHVLDLPGTLSYYQKAAVHSKVPGRVATVLADAGQKVKRGMPLAKMETFDLQIRLRQAQSGVRSARAGVELRRARYQQARRNIEKELKGMQRLQAEIVNARAGFLNAKTNLRNKKELFELGGVSRSELRSVHADYLAAMARYYQTKKDYETGAIGFRNKDLRLAGLRIPTQKKEKRQAFDQLNTRIEKQELHAAQATLKNAQLDLQTVRLMLKEAVVRSPIAGTVAARNVEVGEQPKPDEPLFTIVSLHPLIATTAVSEKDLGELSKNAAANVIVEALGPMKHAASIHSISPVVDSRTRSAEVRLKLNNQDGALRPGMFSRIKLSLRTRKDGLSVPISLVEAQADSKDDLPDLGDGHTRNDRTNPTNRKSKIFVIRNNIAFEREVQLGRRFGERIEIISGLEHGECVAASNLQLLKDGTPVSAPPCERQKENTKSRPEEKK